MISNARPTPVVLLLGPTASGKTAAALALAARFPVEIISVDSACVYRGMDIGTAKPSSTERAAVAHHLIDCTDPWQPYSAARFASDARAAIAAIQARGNLPLLVGGTMLYAKALMQGLDDLPAADPAIRARFEQQAQAIGWPALHARLAQFDAATAARLAPQDAQRISRALEIIELTGQPMSELLAKNSVDSSHTWHVFALMPSQRAVLHQRIAQRFEQMLTHGLIEEVQTLRRDARIHAELPAMRCVGYRQCWQMLDGTIKRGDLPYRGITATRQLAKRQLTWLRSMRPDMVVDCTATGEQAPAPLDLASAFARVCGLASAG